MLLLCYFNISIYINPRWGNDVSEGFFLGARDEVSGIGGIVLEIAAEGTESAIMLPEFVFRKQIE